MYREELEKGWVIGPFSNLDQVADAVGGEFVLNRRFPLRQKLKLRQIDDCSESNVNSAFASPLKLHFTDVDVLSVVVGLITDLVSGVRRE
eukprot:1508792-Amphidinium_carterae.1